VIGFIGECCVVLLNGCKCKVTHNVSWPSMFILSESNLSRTYGTNPCQ
jgi:hypothetical protein